MSWEGLKKRNPAEVTFSGLGLWDVFAVPGRHYIGTVAMDANRPPFVRGNDPDYHFAPDHLLFARGVVQLEENS